MDNTSYHSVQTEKVPNILWTHIMEWLTSKNITFVETYIKAELINPIPPSLKKECSGYKVDKMVANTGR